MRMTSVVVLLAVPLFALDLARAPGLAAQLGDSGLTIDVHGGLASFGRLLEQHVGPREREVRAANGGSFGGAVGIQPWEDTALRLGVSFQPTQIDLRDDTGLGQVDATIEREGVADMDALVVSVEAATFILGEFSVFKPYTLVGVAAGWWSLGDQGSPATIVAGDNDSKFGLGGTGGLGLEIRPGSAFAVRLEAAQYRLGNPFNGEDAWRVSTGQTFDEPESVRISRYTVGVGISIGG